MCQPGWFLTQHSQFMAGETEAGGSQEGSCAGDALGSLWMDGFGGWSRASAAVWDIHGPPGRCPDASRVGKCQCGDPGCVPVPPGIPHTSRALSQSDLAHVKLQSSVFQPLRHGNIGTVPKWAPRRRPRLPGALGMKGCSAASSWDGAQPDPAPAPSPCPQGCWDAPPVPQLALAGAGATFARGSHRFHGRAVPAPGFLGSGIPDRDLE